MRTIANLIFIAAVSLTPAVAQGFLDIPASNTWTKVQDGEASQWSIIPSAHPKTRIDFISYLEKDGTRTSYYMVRSSCSDGDKVAAYTIKPGYQLGLGVNCNGDVVSGTFTPIGEAPKLPPVAAAFLH